MKNYNLVVIGAGPAGLAAAIEAKKSGVDSILIIERDCELGGILQQCIHNGFGLSYFKEELTGPEYAERFIDEAKDLNIEIMMDTMVLEMTASKELVLSGPERGIVEIKARSIILAMGCRERTAGAIAVPGHRPAGVLTAGTAQKYINKQGLMVGKKIIILGSGDIGLIMARRMTLEGAEVEAVVEIMPYSGGLNRNIVQCLEDYDIPLMLSHSVTKIHGKNRVEGVTIQKVDENLIPIEGTETHFDCDTLLLSVGLIPENELSRQAEILIDGATKGMIVDETMQTSISGIFACGNVVHVHDLVDYVTEEGQRAGRAAAKYILGQREEINEPPYSTHAGNGIRYVVPQKINRNSKSETLYLFMRSKDVYKDAELSVKVDGLEILRKREDNMVPSEMIRLKLDKALIPTDGKEIIISVIQGDQL